MCILVVVLAVMLSACVNNDIREEASDTSDTTDFIADEETSDTSDTTNFKADEEAFAALDTTGFGVCFDIHMTSNLILIPNYFDKVYGVENKYMDAIDAWGELQYSEAEKQLLEVEAAIENSEAQYCPDDIAFVKEALGLLYCDTADYRKAYDYLIDAYVTMNEIYGDKKNMVSLEQFYPDAIKLALCHYYYTIGDYDRCLKEIQDLRDSDEEIAVNYETAYLKSFISYIMNDIEAGIYKDRGEYKSAYNLYYENFKLCENYIGSEENFTLGCILEINACTHLGDCLSTFKIDSKLAEKADSYYDRALQICDLFSEYLAEKYKSEVLMKKGKFLANFSDKQDEALKILDEAISIQERLYESGKTSPDIIKAYITYAEVNGFVKRDLDEALFYYDKALNVAQTIFGYNHPETAMAYESLGRFYANRMDDIEQAIEYLDKSIDIYRNLLIENNVQVAGIYLQLAGCHKTIGENEISDEYLEKAYDMYGALGIHILQTDKTYK